jgi:hypothetical protein
MVNNLNEKINTLELELVTLEDILEEQKSNKVVYGKVLGLRTALHVLTGKSYEPIEGVEKETYK